MLLKLDDNTNETIWQQQSQTVTTWSNYRNEFKIFD